MTIYNEDNTLVAKDCDFSYTFDIFTNEYGSYSVHRVNTARHLNNRMIYCNYAYKNHSPVYHVRKYTQCNSLYMNHDVEKRRNSIYVHPDCTVPRDLLRHNYDIKRSRENADFTIIPKVKIYGEQIINAIFKVTLEGKEGIVFVRFSYYSIDASNNIAPSTREDYIKIISNEYPDFNENSVEEIFLGNSSKNTKICNLSYTTAYLINKCDEYIDVIDKGYDCTNMVSENKIAYDAPVKISLDVLTIWKNTEDKQLLIKNIICSDWYDYPITMCVFISNVFGRYLSKSNFCDAFKDILERLKVQDVTNSIIADRANFTITEKDMNMLQDYLFNKIGVNDDKGFADFDKFYLLDTYERKLIRNKFAVSKIKISNDSILSDVIK